MQLRARFLAFLASTFLRLVGRTSRIIWVNRSIHEELVATGQGFIYAFWHGRQVFLAYAHKNNGAHPLISRSRDGELIARVCLAMGLSPVRGSSSRGGAEALLELKSILEKGERVCFTPDGPRGPLRRVQPGVIFAAQKSGCPILPVSFGAKRAWVMKGSWDEFVVPKPFNRICVAYGEPVHVGPTDNADQKAAELRVALDAVNDAADSVASA